MVGWSPGICTRLLVQFSRHRQQKCRKRATKCHPCLNRGAGIDIIIGDIYALSYSKDTKFIKLGEKLQALRDKHEFVGEIMIILVTGASHTGKTALAQKLLEKYKYPYLSIDHLKMGLIRSGNTELTPMDDNELTEYLWPIVCEMIKTAIENKQNLIVEGGYIPFDWQKDFDSEYLKNIKYYCLVMTEKYIRNHFANIKKYANVIENRLDDEWCTMESVLADNAEMLSLAQKYDVNHILIDDKYEINIEL